jgi:hypothetical protein
MELTRLLYASSLKYSRAVFREKTFSPKMAVILEEEASVTSAPAVKLSIALKRSDCML